MPRIFTIILLLCLYLPGTVLANTVNEDPRERQMLQIASKLRCAVCQNQPVSESHSGLASDMRTIIREQLDAGKSEEEIIDYFVARYGDYVLLKPRKSGPGFVLWVLPPVLLLFAGGFAWVVMRKRQRGEVDAGQRLSEEDRERIRRAREKDDEQ